MSETTPKPTIPTPIDSPEQESAPTEQEVPGSPDQPLLPCSYNLCSNSHYWPIVFKLAACPGCNSPVMAVKMQNCPYCNEPASSTQTRTDITTEVLGLKATCQGQTSQAITALTTIEWPKAGEPTSKEQKVDVLQR